MPRATQRRRLVGDARGNACNVRDERVDVFEERSTAGDNDAFSMMSGKVPVEFPAGLFDGLDDFAELFLYRIGDFV